MNSRTLALASALLIGLGLTGFGLIPGERSHADPPASVPPLPTSAVRVVVDYKDGVQKCFLALEHRSDMTALDATIDAGRHARGIKLEYTGKADMAFINQIDDLRNQGPGKASRNWQFRINGKHSTRGAGVTKLASGDTLLWEYTTMPVAE
mgnify:CR=1 FL=1